MQIDREHRPKRTVLPDRSEEFEIDADRLQAWPCLDHGCNDCDHHFRHLDDQLGVFCKVYRRNIPPQEAAQITKSLTASASTNRSRLQQLLNDHGDLFMSRWKKRSKDKRTELLLRADPKLPDRRCMEMFRLTQSNDGDFDWHLTRTDHFRFGALLPYLAVDDLKDNPALLFALLHHRTKYTLEDWAAFDNHQFRNAWESAMLDVDFSPHCVMLHGAHYGDLVPFESQATHRQDTVGFPRAQFLLEAQSTLMSFLVRMVELPLEGANLENKASSKWFSMCSDGFRVSGDVAQWSTYNQAPFSPPPTLDIDAIISTAQLRFNALADHLALLQTDPAYTRRHVRLALQGSAYKSAGSEAFAIVNAQISSEAKMLYWWLCVKEEAEHVKYMQNRFRDQFGRGRPLPPKYDRALASLELVLVNFMIERCSLCYCEFQQRPGFAKYISFKPMKDGVVSHVRIDRDSIPRKFEKDPLYWCLFNLCAEPDLGGSFDHSHLFAFLEKHLASSSAEERARLDQVMLHRFSDLAANHQLLLAVRLNRPQNVAGDADEMFKTESRRAWRDCLMNAGLIDNAGSRGPLLKRFYETAAPSGRRNQAWIDQHDKVHSSLTAYWAAVRKAADHHMKDENVAPDIKADLDPDHQAELQQQRRAIAEEIALRATIPGFKDGFQNANNETLSFSKKSATKTKAKTRPRPSTDQALATPLTQDSGPEHQPSTRPTIPTTKRAISVLSKMFSLDVEASTQGCDWTQLVHALKDIGFAARNGAGSAVVFELEEKGKIIFHRPHPVPKVDPIMLRAMGKRLQKWFGWRLESFAVGT